MPQCIKEGTSDIQWTFRFRINLSLSSVHAHVAQQKSRDESVHDHFARQKSQKIYKENSGFLLAIFVARCQHKHFCGAIFLARHEHKQSLQVTPQLRIIVLKVQTVIIYGKTTVSKKIALMHLLYTSPLVYTL